MRTMSASACVLERPAPVTPPPILVRVFVGFLPISEADRSACGFCGAPAEGPPEPVGNWGLVVFTCPSCRIFDAAET